MAIVIAVFPFVGQPLLAQPTSDIYRTATDDVDGLLPEGARPDFVLLKNDAGGSFVVPKIKYEEYERIVKSATDGNLDSSPVLEQLSLDLQIEGAIARIQGEVKSVLSQPNTKSIPIPLGLGTFQMLPPSGEAPFPLSVASNGGGYVWRLPPGDALERRLSFQAVANVPANAKSNSLRIMLPATTCTIMLTLPDGDWDVNTTGSESETVEPVEDSRQQSKFRIRASGGPIELSWRQKARSDHAQATEGVSTTKFVLQNDSTTPFATTRLTLSGPKRLGGRRFLVSLPFGAEWKEPSEETSSFSGYKLTPQSTVEGSDVEGSGLSIVVDIDESFSNFQVEVQLDWISHPLSNGQSLEFADIKLEGVDRHVANIDLMLPRGRTLLWEPQSGIEFIKRSVSTDSSELIQHTFRVLVQNRSLICRILQQQSTPLIKADYRVWLFPDRWMLNGTIDFQDTTKNLPFLQFESRGWEVEWVSVASTGREIAFTEGAGTEGENVIVPLSLNDLTDSADSATTNAAIAEGTGSRRIQVRLVKKLPASIELLRNEQGPTKLDFVLPMLSWLDEANQERRLWSPVANLSVYSSIASLEPIGLQQDGSRWNLATTQSNSTDQALKEARAFNQREGSPRFSLAMQIRGDQSPFSCEFTPSILDSIFETTTTYRATAHPQWWKIEQDWLVQIKGAFPTHLILAVPISWLATDEDVPLPSLVDVNVNGTLITDHIPLESEVAERWDARYPMLKGKCTWTRLSIPPTVYFTTSSDSAWLVTVTPQKTIPRDEAKSERFEQSLAYLDSDNERAPNQYVSSVCLIQRSPETRLLLNEKQLPRTQSEFKIGDDRWIQTRLTLQPDSPLLDITIVPESTGNENKVSVERAWVQTAIKPRELRHRYVLRFRTSLPTLTLNLSEALQSNASGILNGEQIKLDPIDTGSSSFKIDLTEAPPFPFGEAPPEDGPPHLRSPLYVLELFSWPSYSGSLLQRIELPKLEIEASDYIHTPVVWQVISAQSDHLVSTSESLAPDYAWKWSQYFFARNDSLSQLELENEFGATRQPELSNQLNQYTLVAFDTEQDSYVTFAPRYVIWTPVAIAALALAAGAFRTSYLQKWVVGPIGIPLTLLLAFWSLDTTILIAQSMVVALLVVLVFTIASWFMDRSARKRSVFAGRASSSNGVAPSRGDSRAEALSGSASKSLATTVAPQGNVPRNATTSNSDVADPEGIYP